MLSSGPAANDELALANLDPRANTTPGIHEHFANVDSLFSRRAPDDPQHRSEHAVEATQQPGDAAATNPAAPPSGQPLPDRSTQRPASPSEATTGARSGEELLRRLSLTDSVPRPDQTLIDPYTAHPALGLSGNVISASFCVPYKIAYNPCGDWVRCYDSLIKKVFSLANHQSQALSPRRGTSALFDSFDFLASPDSPWKHKLVGWTGEIDRVVSFGGHGPGANGITTIETGPLNKASAPVPVNPHAKPAHANEQSDLRIPADDREKLAKLLSQEHEARVTPVWLPDETDDADVGIFRNQTRWRRYGEHELFTLFHYKQNEPTDGRALRKAWADYYHMNQAFADSIVRIYTPGDIVLIHDYQLLLLPSLLRQKIPNIYIGFFLHVPFPSSEYYRCLTRRKEILEGVLGANMIGFQAYSYARHFSSCCTRILGFDSSAAGVDAYGAHVPVDVFPIGVNAESTLRLAFDDPETESKTKALRELYEGKKIIVGRDRLDSVRGVAQKLQAFEIFLERHPEWHDKVILIQVTSPTSMDSREETNDKTANKVSELVARINGTFGSLSFAPVQHYPQYLLPAEYFALLRVADVGLITSVRDGMNTTALEYVLCQRDHHGPLIISEFSGTAGSLGNAIHINPWDLAGTANEINTALTMSDADKQKQHQLLYEHVTTNTVQAWTNNYLKRLLTNLASYDQSISTPLLDRAMLLSQYCNSTRRLFMFDYDGTLTPIVKDPQSAIPSDRVIRTLKSLASDPLNQVWIISGRDQAFLDEWMGHISELGLSAEHGSFIRMPNTTVWENLTETLDMSWQEEVIKVFNHLSERTHGSFIERKKIALTWHYRRADPEYGAYMARECQKYLEGTVVRKYDVEVMAGKANLEVRPRFVNKGEIAKRLVNAYGNEIGKFPDFVLCLGDDFTDEGMFASFHLLVVSAPFDFVKFKLTDLNRRHVPYSPSF